MHPPRRISQTLRRNPDGDDRMPRHPDARDHPQGPHILEGHYLDLCLDLSLLRHVALPGGGVALGTAGLRVVHLIPLEYVRAIEVVDIIPVTLLARAAAIVEVGAIVEAIAVVVGPEALAGVPCTKLNPNIGYPPRRR